MKKKWLAVICAVALVTGICSPAVAGAEETGWMPNTFMISDEVLEQIEKEEPAITAYEEIIEGLGIALPSDSEYPNYPSEYGGAYYQDEKLHICLTENTAENQQKYLLLTSDDSVVQFETVEYSYNDLYEITLQIADNCGASISSVGIDVENNLVDVGIDDNLQGQDVPAVVSEIPVRYSYEEKASSAATELIGGNGVSNGTLTICGTWQGSNAVLTAGHCVTEGSTYRYGGSVLGTGAYSRYDMDQFYDYGVIKITGSGFTTTNKVLNGANYTTITSTLRSSSGLVGTTVCKYGKIEKFGVAKIVKVDAIVSYKDGPVLYGMSKADFTSGTGYKGDSGGPIYSGHTLYGIYSGDDADPSDRSKTATYFWYSPIYGAAGFTVKTS